MPSSLAAAATATITTAFPLTSDSDSPASFFHFVDGLHCGGVSSGGDGDDIEGNEGGTTTNPNSLLADILLKLCQKLYPYSVRDKIRSVENTLDQQEN